MTPMNAAHFAAQNHLRGASESALLRPDCVRSGGRRRTPDLGRSSLSPLFSGARIT